MLYLFIHFKCIVWWILMYDYITQVMKYSYHPNSSSDPICSPSLFNTRSWKPPWSALYQCRLNLSLLVSYKWNYTMCMRSCLSSFIQHHMLKNNPHCFVYSWAMSFERVVITVYMWFVNHWQDDWQRVVSSFGLLWIILLWTFAHRFLIGNMFL